jgi:hypothetical protein
MALMLRLCTFVLALALGLRRGRAQQQGPSMPQFLETRRVRLEEACAFQSLTGLLIEQHKEGVACVLAASVVGMYDVLRYDVNISAAVYNKISLNIIIEPFEGSVDMCVLCCGRGLAACPNALCTCTPCGRTQLSKAAQLCLQGVHPWRGGCRTNETVESRFQ